MRCASRTLDGSPCRRSRTVTAVELRIGRPEDVEDALEVWRAGRAAQGNRAGSAVSAGVRERLAARSGLLVVLVADGRVVGAALGEWRELPPVGPAAAGPADAGLSGGPDAGGPVAGGSAADGGVTPDLLHVALVAVDPAHRRQGLGTRLLEGLADEAYARGARRISAWSQAPTGDAFYRACGLMPFGGLPGDGPPGDDTPPGDGQPGPGLPGQQPLSDGGQPGRWVADLDPPLRELPVRDGAIRLGQLLKLAGLVDTGAEGKALLAEGGVEVNGEVEVRRGRQLVAEDVVVARAQAVRVTALAAGLVTDLANPHVTAPSVAPSEAGPGVHTDPATPPAGR